ATGAVTVASGAKVKSDVSAARIEVAGAVHGNLAGEEAVVLEDGARVVGDLSAPTIAIRPGALMRGHVETGSAPQPGRPAARATAARTVSTPSRAAAPARRAPEKVPAPRASEPKKKAAPAPVMPKAPAQGRKTTKKKA